MDVTSQQRRIVKRFEEFIELSEELKLRYQEILIPIPFKTVAKANEKELQQMLEFFEIFLNTIGKGESVGEECFLHFVGAIVGSELSTFLAI